MSISEMQACLARLYVDDCFRKLFYLDPDETVRHYRLTPDEASALKNIDRRMLDFFAGSLKNKRKGGLERAYPLLFRVTSDAIGRYYHRYYQLHVVNPHQPGYQDIMDFGVFMEESMADGEDVPAYASEVARYERLCYWTNFCPAVENGTGATASVAREAVRTDDRLQRRRAVQLEPFSYDVTSLEEKLRSSSAADGEIELERGEYYVLFRPASQSYNSRVLRVNHATKTLIDLCDGSRTTSQIISAVEEQFGTTNLEQVLFTAIDRLLTAGAIQLVRS
jgi:hypothetical protein